MSHSPKVSLNDDTYEWLQERYPDAMSDAEAVRMAINDARNAERERVAALRLAEDTSESKDGDD